ncbi:MAG: MBOAT family protein [Actinobacteria bacterium]|nr:MBOAT family protein [Actinomycetota bacterium]
MLLNSYSFLLVFLPTVVILYWLVPRGYPRLVFLIVASLVFYGLWDWRFIPLLLATTLTDWVAGRYLAKSEAEGASRRRKLILAAAVTVNLAFLGYFKYRGFFVEQFDGILQLLGAGEPLPALKLLLPIGISFYTFAGISYAVDMYRGQYRPAKSVIHYLAWVTLFPYILAGPIIRYGHVGEQLEQARQRLTWALVGSGLFFLAMGAAKKILVADMMAPYVNELFSHHAHLGLWSGWAAALGYTLQLYFDFSGYSDMAVGVALLIGLRFPQNFDSPYKAINPSDFWRRWHMTLSGWLRDYLFIPLGGSRGSTWLTVRNLMITFLLGGLWHGPAWTYVFWGLLWGLYQSVHVVARKYGLTPTWVWLNRILTFLGAVVAFVFFRASSLRAAKDVLESMAGLQGVSGEDILPVAPLLGAFVVGGLLWVNLLPNTWEIQPRPKLRYALVLGILLAASLLALSKPSPFLYVQF